MLAEHGDPWTGARHAVLALLLPDSPVVLCPHGSRELCGPNGAGGVDPRRPGLELAGATCGGLTQRGT